MINLGCELRYLWQVGEFAMEHIEEHKQQEWTGNRAVLCSCGRRGKGAEDGCGNMFGGGMSSHGPEVLFEYMANPVYCV